MKKPTIEVKCDATSQDLLTFHHTPSDITPDEVWAIASQGDSSIYIKMTCERARALGEALLKVYGNNEEPTKITI